MKLQSIHREISVFHRHDLSVGILADDGEAVRHGVPLCCQGMVSGHRQFFRQPLKDQAVRIDLNAALFAVHEAPGMADSGTVHLADGLMAQADAQNGDMIPQTPHHILADARVLRISRPWG